MKVLHIIPNLGSGGAEKMLVDIIREMQNQKVVCEVAVLTERDNFFGDDLKELNIKVYFSTSNKVYSLKNITFLKKIIRETKYDIIHTHLFAPQLLTPIALKNKKKMSLVTTEHSTHNKRRNYKLFRILDYWMYRNYKKVIAITEDTKKSLVKYLPYLENRTIVVENGIDIPQYSGIPAILRRKISKDIKKEEKIVLMVAAMRNQKDPETLIRASKLLPKNYRVIFVGDGERMEEVRNYARIKGRDSILFLGSRKDVPSIMKASDIFVLSSKWEGFGLVTVEAAATGLPVVASNVDGLKDVVQNIGGYLFEPFNEKDLVDKILLAELDYSGSNRLKKYSIQRTVKEYIEVYQNVINLL